MVTVGIACIGDSGRRMVAVKLGSGKPIAGARTLNKETAHISILEHVAVINRPWTQLVRPVSS
jgi:hypothetical protein